MFSAVWRGSLKVSCPLQLFTFLNSLFPSNWKCQINFLPCPIQISTKLGLIPQTQNLPFSLIQQTTSKSNQTLLHIYLAWNQSSHQSSQASLIIFLLRLTRREPSLDLVGLATRLSVVWCYPRLCLPQPEVDLGPNIVVTILGRKFCFFLYKLQTKPEVNQVAFETLFLCISESRWMLLQSISGLVSSIRSNQVQIWLLMVGND